jgi:hypothetical protein
LKARRRGIKKWGLGLGVTGAAAVLFFSLLPKPLMLLDRAKPYRDSKGMLEFGFEYSWLSDHEILFKGRRFGRPYTIFDDWVTRMDLRTMKEMPTAPLNKLIIKEVLELKGGPSHLNISPDGKWLLWSTLVSAYSQKPPGTARGTTAGRIPIKPHSSNTLSIMTVT